MQEIFCCLAILFRQSLDSNVPDQGFLLCIQQPTSSSSLQKKHLCAYTYMCSSSATPSRREEISDMPQNHLCIITFTYRHHALDTGGGPWPWQGEWREEGGQKPATYTTMLGRPTARGRNSTSPEIVASTTCQCIKSDICKRTATCGRFVKKQSCIATTSATRWPCATSSHGQIASSGPFQHDVAMKTAGHRNFILLKLLKQFQNLSEGKEQNQAWWHHSGKGGSFSPPHGGLYFASCSQAHSSTSKCLGKLWLWHSRAGRVTLEKHKSAEIEWKIIGSKKWQVKLRFGDFVSFPLCLPKLLLCHAAVVGGRLQGHVHFAAEGLESPKANSFAVLLWFSTSLWCELQEQWCDYMMQISRLKSLVARFNDPIRFSIGLLDSQCFTSQDALTLMHSRKQLQVLAQPQQLLIGQVMKKRQSILGPRSALNQSPCLSWREPCHLWMQNLPRFKVPP